MLNRTLRSSIQSEASSTQSAALSARVLFKPDGVTRVLSASETDTIVATWNGLLNALAQAPNSNVADTGLASELPSIIASRQSYRSGYSLDSWRTQARACRRLAGICGSISVYALHSEIFNGLELERSARRRTHLSVEEVEAIYSPSQWFAEDPTALISYMCSGPIIKEMWRGPNIEIALLVKFAIRNALGISGRYNLVHCDLVDGQAVAM